VLCAIASRSYAPDAVRTTRVRVSAGDTLWAIAEQYGTPRLTTAQTAHLIARFNALDSATLTPGRELEIPVPGTAPTRIAAK
jgi:LysM repeat protein